MAATKNKLKAAAATSGLFEKTTDQGKGKKKSDPQTETKRDLQTFSVKIDSDVLKRWRIYASMNGYGNVGKLTEAALDEYMNRHKLTAEQQAKFHILYGID